MGLSISVCVLNLVSDGAQMYTTYMPLNDDEIRKKVKDFEESLPDDQRNPKAKEDFRELTERAAKPLPKDTEKSEPSENYTETQTRSHSTGDTSG